MEHLEESVDPHRAAFQHAQDRIDRRQCGAESAVDHIHGRNDADIFGLRGDCHGFSGAHAFCHDAAQNIVLIIRSGADETFTVTDSRLFQHFFVGRVAVDDQNSGRKRVKQFFTFLLVFFDKADIITVRAKRRSKETPRNGDAGNDDPRCFDGRCLLRDPRDEIADILVAACNIHLVTGNENRVAVGNQELFLPYDCRKTDRVQKPGIRRDIFHTGSREQGGGADTEYFHDRIGV